MPENEKPAEGSAISETPVEPPPPSLSPAPSSPPPPSLSPAPSSPPPPVIAGAPEIPVASGDPAPIPGSKAKPLEVEEEEAGTPGSTADVNPRLIAGLLDVLIAIGLSALVAWIIPFAWLSGKLAWLTAVAYLLFRDSLPFMPDGSVGKKVMKLKVVKSDGSSLVKDWRTAAIRNVPLIIPFFGLIEAIVLFTRDSTAQKGQRLGDDWAKTKVVYAGEREARQEEPKAEEV